jgi:5-guanidino-2-oxopentanoate decarboxylase
VVSVPPPRPARRPRGSAAEVRDALTILAAASRPGLLLGGGAQDAAPEVGRLARALDAIVVTTINGKGAFPEDDELAIGAALGSTAGREALAACDLVLAIGTEVAETDLEAGPLALRGRLIRVDIDPGQLQMNLPADRALGGDAATTVRALLAELGPERQGEGAARAREARRRVDEEVRGRAGDLTWVMEGMSEALSEDVIVACDTTQLTYYGVLPARFARRPRSCFNPTGYATLGYALPAAIGAKVARPDRRALVVAGDGGVLFTLPELATAVDLALQLPIVITNNRGYGEIREGMVARRIDPFGVTFDPPRFTQVAEAFGARAAVAHDAAELRAALRTAFQVEGPTLIEAVLPS